MGVSGGGTQIPGLLPPTQAQIAASGGFPGTGAGYPGYAVQPGGYAVPTTTSTNPLTFGGGGQLQQFPNVVGDSLSIGIAMDH